MCPVGHQQTYATVCRTSSPVQSVFRTHQRTVHPAHIQCVSKLRQSNHIGRCTSRNRLLGPIFPVRQSCRKHAYASVFLTVEPHASFPHHRFHCFRSRPYGRFCYLFPGKHFSVLLVYIYLQSIITACRIVGRIYPESQRRCKINRVRSRISLPCVISLGYLLVHHGSGRFHSGQYGFHIAVDRKRIFVGYRPV